MSLLPSTQNKSWWSRGKPAKGPHELKPSRSFSNTTADSETSLPALQGSTKQKDPAGGLRLKSLGSAMGFKSKKLSTLTIQDPPPMTPDYAPQIYNAHSDPGTRDATFAPSQTHYSPTNAVSADRPRDYDGDARSARTISEPRTPLDNARASYQPSVLTFSELDPFHASEVIIQQSSNDPNRLSAYSDTSMLDPNCKTRDTMFHNRISYGSSSSNSHGHSSEGQSSRLTSPRLGPSLSSGSERLRQNSLRGRDVPMLVPEHEHSRRQTPGSNPSSSSTVTSDPQNRLSDPPPSNSHFFLPRSRGQPARARGMTIATAEVSSSRGLRSAGGLFVPSDMPMPPQLNRKASDPFNSPTPSSNAPSPSPVIFSRSRSSTVTSTDSPVSPNSTRPLVVVRKASSSRVQLPPLSSIPPSADLPPPPSSPVPSGLGDSFEDLAAFPDVPSSSSSSMSFAPSVDFDSGDMINQFMRQSMKHSRKGKAAKRREKDRGHPDVPSSPSRTVRELSFEKLHMASTSKFSLSSTMRGEELASESSGGPSYGSSKMLRKANSQSSLLKRYSNASVTSSVTSGSGCQDEPVTGKATSSPLAKIPRKQRSFHHSRLPIPPLPTLRHANSYTTATHEPTSPFPTTPTYDQPQQSRRGSITSPGGTSSARKRLFSGSSARRSTSSQAPLSPSLSGEDDVRSVYSIEDTRSTTQRIAMSFGSLGNPLSLLTSNACVAPSSYITDTKEDAGDESYINEKRVSQSDYVPQHIMPPADMLKLEQQLAQEAESGGYRGHQFRHLELEISDLGDALVGGRKNTDTRSIRSKAASRLSTMSAGTLAFGPTIGDSSDRMSLAPSTRSAARHTASPAKAKGRVIENLQTSTRSSSVLGQNSLKPPLTVRPSTAQPSLPSPSYSTFSSAHSPPQSTISLPPPPRSRASQPHTRRAHHSTDKRSSVVPLHPLSPPPRKNRSQPGGYDSTGQASHPPSAFEQKVAQRRSIMKKPSFLDIDDEADQTMESLSEAEEHVSPSSPPMESSFLDMEGKDSFDTVRSSDSLLYLGS